MRRKKKLELAMHEFGDGINTLVDKHKLSYIEVMGIMEAIRMNFIKRWTEECLEDKAQKYQIVFKETDK